MTLQAATIPRTPVLPPHIDYKDMVLEGIQSIQKMGHDHWTNYNSSDPGRTILDMMIFALLDQGYKTEFPIEDLLSDKKNQLRFNNLMYKAEEILFSNPVTLNDHRKLIIDRAENIKNVWIEPWKVRGGINGILFTTYELSDPLKIIYHNYLNGQFKGDEKDEVKSMLDTIRTGIYAVQCQHRNLGDFILHPFPLTPVLLEVSGEIYFQNSVEPEMGIAKVLYRLNNLISSYIHFKTYDQLLQEGLNTETIMSGPCLENGFIEDDDLKPLLKSLSKDKCRSSILTDDVVERVEDFSFGEKNVDPITSSSFKIAPGTIPFFDYSSIASKFSGSKLSLFQGRRRVSSLDQAKIDAYYASLTERKPVGSYNFKNELGPVIPEGKYRDLSTYHSIQKLFSQQFGLDVDTTYEGIPKSKRGPAKQLKAYLMLFEQIVADHQAQLDHLPDLLSFNSGIKAGDPICKTRYAKGLYDTPGSRFILKAFDTYKSHNQYVAEHPRLMWDGFIEDEDNEYENFINSFQNEVKDDIDQKFDVLSHLLARLGEKFDERIISEFNPTYGDYKLANVQIISDLLKNFDQYSGNMNRSYFAQDSHKNILFSGLEIRFGLLFQLNDFYQELEEKILKSLSNEDSDLAIHGDVENNKISILEDGKAILEVPFTSLDVIGSINDNIKVLNQIRIETKGFVLIDNQLIINNLLDEEWLVMVDDVWKFFKDRSSRIWKTFNVGNAHKMLRRIGEKTKRKLALAIKKRDEAGNVKMFSISDQETFQGKISIFLPDGLPKLQEESFQQLFNEQITNDIPAHLEYDVHYLSTENMKLLLDLRSVWLEGFQNLQKGKEYGLEASIANLLLLEFMLDLNEGTQ
ncbi:hypothetical protein [Ekhidna sp.]|uniref:hypothetical protein n=1 Tax=Ekhidna sp. TaxID=2608089 RepID=UPI0032979473